MLRTAFFPQERSARAINQREKRGSVTYNADRENEVSKIFIISRERNDFQISAARTAKYDPQK